MQSYLGPCGGCGWLYLVSEPVTDTDTCRFIGLTPLECPLNEKRPYQGKYCVKVSLEQVLSYQAYHNTCKPDHTLYTLPDRLHLACYDSTCSVEEVLPPVGDYNAIQLASGEEN